MLTVLFFFQSPYAIFAHILQHYHDFQSNVKIFPSVSQAYTQPYSFDGSIKQIIFQIGYELSVVINEIRNSLKKTLDGGPYTSQQRIKDWQNINSLLFYFKSKLLNGSPYIKLLQLLSSILHTKLFKRHPCH